MAGPNMELSRLFSLMQEGVDPENLFTALRAAGGGGNFAGGELGGSAVSLPQGFSLPQGLSLPAHLAHLTGLEGLQMPPMSQADDGGGTGGALSGEGAGGTSEDEEDDHGSVGGVQGPGGLQNPPPRTGCINDRKCTKVLPASSSAPKYKFVVPNEYVYKFMKHLVERQFHMRDAGGKLWECVLIQRKNKEKYEYMIQGWRRFGEATAVQEGDTVTIEMVGDTTLQVTVERTGGGSGGKKRPRTSGGGGGGGMPAPGLMQQGGMKADAHDGGGMHGDHHDGDPGLMGRAAPQHGGIMPPLGGLQHGGGGPYAVLGDPGLGPGGGGAQHPLLDLLNQHQQQAAAQQQQLANGLPPGNPLPGGAVLSEAHLAELSTLMHQHQAEKRQRLSDGPPGGGGPPGGAIGMLSDAANVEHLVQQNRLLREELGIAQGKINTLETGVLNIKSVLTRNTDPGLIAMTGVINLLNQMEANDFLPELTTIGRMTLTGLCSEVRKHLNGVLRMVWILRSLPDDVQQQNGGPGGAMPGGPPGLPGGPG